MNQDALIFIVFSSGVVYKSVAINFSITLGTFDGIPLNGNISQIKCGQNV